MQTQTIIGVIVFLIIGFSGGYFVGINKKDTPPTGAHIMPDGSIMQDDGSAMAGMMMDMNAALRGKTGDALDKAFLEEMIVHHEGAIEMAELLLAGTKRPELQKLGTAIITAQTSEIEQMKEWRAQWFTR